MSLPGEAPMLPEGEPASRTTMLHDRVVLVSGGTQGVGAGVARAAAAAGAHVAVTGRRVAVGEQLVADATQRAFHGAGDRWTEEAALNLPMGKLGQVEELTDLAVLLLSDRSGVVTGSVIDWDQTVFGGQD